MELIKISLLDGKQPKIKKYKELEKKENIYVINEYSRKNNTLLQIGVIVKGAKSVVVTDLADEVCVTLIKAPNDHNLWYEKSETWIEKGYTMRNESVFGMNACGTFMVKAFNEKQDLINSAKVIVLPSEITYHQYLMMKSEVKRIFQGLAIKLTDYGFSREVNEELFPIERLEGIIQQLSDLLEEIVSNPHEQLIQIKTQINKNDIKKWDANSMIEAQLYPFRNKITSKITQRNTQIKEHEMIRKMLMEIRDSILTERILEESLLTELDIDLSNRLHNSIYTPQNLKKDIERSIKNIQNKINRLRKRSKTWSLLLIKVKTLLEESIFNGDQVPELTHLFSTDLLYGAVFDLYEEYKSLIPELNNEENDFVDTILSSPHLFEVWVLFQIIQNLVSLQYNFENIKGSLISYYLKNRKNIEGWKGLFTSNDKESEMLLGYNIEIKQVIHTKPDFIILQRKSGENNWNGHTLDAKYKPYSKLGSMGKLMLKDDIKRSCTRYYDGIELKNTEMKSSSIIHIDSNIKNWNYIADSPIHSIAHFSVAPGNTVNLQTYLKKTLHFFGELYDKCPTCGGESEKIDQSRYKDIYLCTEDNEVWVVNTCRYKMESSHPTNMKLMKYANNNYNEQVENEWNVHCPACHKDYHGKLKIIDIFGDNIT